MKGGNKAIMMGLLALIAAPVSLALGDPGGDPYPPGDNIGYGNDGPGPALTHQLDVRKVLARQQAGAYWRRFSPFLSTLERDGGDDVASRAFISPVSGESATAGGWSLWLSGSPAHLRNRLNSARSKGHSLSSTIGLDKQISPMLTLGVGLDNAHSNIRTDYNNGRARTRTHGLGLFINYRFNDWLSLDLQGGYVHQRQKYRRRNFLGLSTGRRHSHGLGASAALNASTWLSSSVQLSGRLGLVGSFDKWRKHTERTPLGPAAHPGAKERLVQSVVEGGVAFWQEPLMPYFKAAHNYDLYRKGGVNASDRDDFTFTSGVFMFAPEGANGLSLGLSGSLVVGRAKQRHYIGALQVKWSW